MFRESRENDKFIKIFLLHIHKKLTHFNPAQNVFSILLLNVLEMLQMFQITIYTSIFTLASHILFIFEILQLSLAIKSY